MGHVILQNYVLRHICLMAFELFVEHISTLYECFQGLKPAFFPRKDDCSPPLNKPH